MSGSLDRLWAGWRAEYVANTGGDEDGCVLCRVLEEDSYVVWRSPLCAVVLNAYPNTNGHVMVLPERHTALLEELEGAEATELWAALAASVQAIKAAYRPDGLNVGANLGRTAGAGVPDHVHFHVLPRWDADTNFMTAVAETRVLPESLPSSHERLQAAWPS